MMEPEDRMLKWFAWARLPAHLQEVSKPFGELAQTICDVVQSGPERTDAAVRATVQPGG